MRPRRRRRTVRGTGEDETLDGGAGGGRGVQAGGSGPALAAPRRRALGDDAARPSSSAEVAAGRARGELTRAWRMDVTVRVVGSGQRLQDAAEAGLVAHRLMQALEFTSIRGRARPRAAAGANRTRLPPTINVCRCEKSMFAPPNNRPRAKLEATVPNSGRSTDARVTDTTKKTEYAVERHSAAPTQPVPMLPAADDAVVEQATVDYKRQEQRVQLDKFQRDLKERLRAAAKAKRAAEVEQYLLSGEYERKVTCGAAAGGAEAGEGARRRQEEAAAPSALAQQCAKQSAATNARCMMLAPPAAAPSARARAPRRRRRWRRGRRSRRTGARRRAAAPARDPHARGRRRPRDRAARARREGGGRQGRARRRRRRRRTRRRGSSGDVRRTERAVRGGVGGVEGERRGADARGRAEGGARGAEARRVRALRRRDARAAARRARAPSPPLPPLDACGTDPLVFDVDNCARNSVYYKNLPLYSRSLSGIIRAGLPPN